MRRLLWSFWLGGFLIANAAAAVPPLDSPPLAPTPSQEALGLASQLVNAIHPDELMVRTNLEVWESMTRKEIGQDPGFTKLESEYPGLRDAAIAEARPIAIEFAREFVRDAKQAKRQILADSLTIAELKQLIAFFGTPAGQRFIKRAASSENAGGFVETISSNAASRSGEITAKDIEKGVESTLPGIIKDTSASDLIEIMRFERLPVAKKFASAGTKADLAIFELMKEASSVWGPKLSDAMAQAALRFTEQKGQ